MIYKFSSEGCPHGKAEKESLGGVEKVISMHFYLRSEGRSRIFEKGKLTNCENHGGPPVIRRPFVGAV